MKSIVKDNKAFHPAIVGIVLLAIVGVTIGVLVMSYSEISSNAITGTYVSTVNNTWNDTTAQATNSWLTLGSKQIASQDGTTPYSITVVNDTGNTLVRGSDYNVTVSNNTLNVKASAAQKNNTMSITYDAESSGTTSFEKIDTNTYKGFDLASITPIVLAASLIITIVIGFVEMMFRKGD